MKTIIFDFDGTLVDSFDVITGIIHKLTAKKITLTDDQVESLRELTVRDIANYLGVKRYKWPFLVSIGRKEMNKQIDYIKLHPGIENCLRRLKKRNVQLYILSSNSKNNIEYIVNKFSLNNIFNKIYGGVGLLSKTRAIKSVMKKNKLKASDLIYIGDEVRDAKAAEAANVAFIGVTWGFNSSNLLKSQNAYEVVDDSKHLIKAIEDWIK